MAKSKKKAAVKKQKQKAVVAKKNANTNAHKYMALSMGVCSVSNPFCDEAVGARWPDNSYTKSAYWGIRGASVANLTTNGSGQVGFLFVPDFGSTVAPYASGTYPSFNFTTLTPVVTFPSNVSRYRITSAGFKIVGAVAPLSASGIVRIRLYSPSTGSSLGSVDMTTVMADEVWDVPVSRLMQKELYVNLMPLGDQLSRVFRSPSSFTTTLANWTNPGWQVASIAIDGPASTKIADIYAYIHYEVVFEDGNSQNMFATHPPPNSLAIQQGNAGVLASVGNFIEGAAEKVDNLFKSKAFRYFASAAAGYMGGPQAALGTYGATKMIKDVD